LRSTTAHPRTGSGNHVDPLYDDHAGVDTYGDTVLRPILRCASAALDALSQWVENGIAPPASHTIARPQRATPAQLADECSVTAARSRQAPG
jgi:hypothetical protein